MDGFTFNGAVPAITVFIQGILSFLSPCVLPLLPVYIGYLSGGAATKDQNGNMTYSRRSVFPRTVCFVLGISFAFLLLGMGMSAFTLFFRKNRQLFTVGGGIIVILFGLYRLGLFGTARLLEAEKRLPLKFDKMAASPLTALLFGFFFSFAWTPCIGPVLTSVLLVASASATRARGFFLIGVYALGFCIPFLMTGWFTTTLLAFFKAHQNVVRYTAKAGAVLMILTGVLMITGHLGALSNALAG